MDMYTKDIECSTNAVEIDKYECTICGKEPCKFFVPIGYTQKPFACPFDKKHNAAWKKK